MNLKNNFCVIFLILLAALAMAIGGYMWDNHTYHDTSHAKVSLQQAAKDGGDTVPIFHKTGCGLW